MNTNNILDRVKHYINCKSDDDLARILRATPQNISNWRARNTIPWEELYRFSQEKKVSLDWMLSGEDSAPESISSWEADIRAACYIVKRIYEEDPALRRALNETLICCSKALDISKENMDMKEMMKQIFAEVLETKNRLNALETMHEPEASGIAKLSKQVEL